MSREDPLKAEKDFSVTLDEQFPIIEKIKDYKEAIDKYLVLEKQTRQASDLASSKRVLAKIVDTLLDKNDWDYLSDLIISLSKKHGQLKTSIQYFLQRIIDRLDTLSNDKKQELETKVKVIEAIRTVTDKKIFVEVERAIVSKKLSEIYLEKYDDLDKAIEILCDLQVETYSMMSFDTKIEYILEQIRLNLQKRDYNQAKILSRKILIKTLRDFDKADLYKSIYLKYLLEISTFENDYLSTVKNLLQLIEIPLIKENKEEYRSHLVSTIYHIILTPYDNHQVDLINRVKRNPVFEKNVDPKIFKLLEIFTTNELIHWSNIESLYRDEYFNKSPIFKDNKVNYENLQHRCVEHNLRIVNKYYLLIKLERLAYLLQVNEEKLEAYVSDLVNKGVIFAKIDRPRGIIRFEQPNNKSENINDLLNTWCYDIDTLLEEIDSIGHLINKEEMMHGIKQIA